MALATRVVCNKEGNGNGGKSDGNKGDGQLMATRVIAMAKTTPWMMAMATRLAGDIEGKGKGGNGKGDNNEGGRQQRGRERQGNGNGNKGGGQVDGNNDKEGNGNEDKIRMQKPIIVKRGNGG
jgi:hypothetical protein